MKKTGAEQAKLALLEAYNNLCDTYVAREKWEDAKTHYRNGIAFGRKLTMPWDDISARRTMAQMYSGLADVFYEENDVAQFSRNCKEAISLCRDVVRRSDKLYDKLKLVILCNRLGVVYLTVEEREQAEPLFSEVVSLCQELLEEERNEDVEEMLDIAQTHLEEIQAAKSNSLIKMFKQLFEK